MFELGLVIVLELELALELLLLVELELDGTVKEVNVRCVALLLPTVTLNSPADDTASFSNRCAILFFCDFLNLPRRQHIGNGSRDGQFFRAKPEKETTMEQKALPTLADQPWLPQPYSADEAPRSHLDQLSVLGGLLERTASRPAQRARKRKKPPAISASEQARIDRYEWIETVVLPDQ